MSALQCRTQSHILSHILSVAAQYAIPVARIAPCRPEAYDDMLGQELWEYLVENVKEA